MIDLNRAPIQSEGLTLFPAATDSNLWYFLPERPGIHRTAEGKLGFVLIKYRFRDLSREPHGGGLLNLAVELGVSAAALDRASSVLRDMQPGGSPTLVPLRPERMICDLQLWTGSGDRHSIASREPAADFPHLTFFEVPLTIESTTMIEVALQSNQPPVSAVYRLTVAARRPALPARITIDWRQTLDFFTERGAIGEPFHSGQIASSVERLLQNGTIRIELPPTTTGREPFVALQLKAVDETVALVMKELFEAGPAMVDAAPAAAVSAGVDPRSSEHPSVRSQTYRLRSSAREIRTATYDLGRPREDTLDLTASAALNPMVPGTTLASLVLEMEELPAPTPRRT